MCDCDTYEVAVCHKCHDTYSGCSCEPTKLRFELTEVKKELKEHKKQLDAILNAYTKWLDSKDATDPEYGKNMAALSFALEELRVGTLTKPIRRKK